MTADIRGASTHATLLIISHFCIPYGTTYCRTSQKQLDSPRQILSHLIETKEQALQGNSESLNYRSSP